MNCFYKEEFIKNPSVLPKPLPMGTMSLLQPTGITAISLWASRIGNVLQFPLRLSRGFTEFFCARACEANCQYRRLCWNEVLKGQLFLTRGTHCIFQNFKCLISVLEWSSLKKKKQRNLVFLALRAAAQSGHTRVFEQTSRICGNALPPWLGGGRKKQFGMI